MFSDGMRGWHLIGQAGLSELEERVVLGACHTNGCEKMKNEPIKIFDERREKEETGWMVRGEEKEKQNGAEKRRFCVWGGGALGQEL